MEHERGNLIIVTAENQDQFDRWIDVLYYAEHEVLDGWQVRVREFDACGLLDVDFPGKDEWMNRLVDMLMDPLT